MESLKVTVLAKNFFGEDDTPTRVLLDAGFEIFHRSYDITDAKATASLIQDSDAVIAGLESYPAELLAQCPRLKLISRRGLGYDAIDVEACRRQGIAIARTVGQVEGAVAEHIMALILHFARNIEQESQQMHRGIWDRKMSFGAKNRTLGLVGFGGIGKELAKRARAFEMDVLYTCRHPRPEWAEEFGVRYASLETLLQNSDFVSVCVPLTAETEGMFDRARFSQMRAGSFFLNAARSPIMDVYALKEALISGHLAGAAVDVFPHEPCTDSPLMGLKNVVLTPHIADFTSENFLSMNRAAAQNVVDFFRGTLDRRFLVCG